jgi:hypothetical protein
MMACEHEVTFKAEVIVTDREALQGLLVLLAALNGAAPEMLGWLERLQEGASLAAAMAALVACGWFAFTRIRKRLGELRIEFGAELARVGEDMGLTRTEVTQWTETSRGARIYARGVNVELRVPAHDRARLLAALTSFTGRAERVFTKQQLLMLMFVFAAMVLGALLAQRAHEHEQADSEHKHGRAAEPVSCGVDSDCEKGRCAIGAGDRRGSCTTGAPLARCGDDADCIEGSCVIVASTGARVCSTGGYSMPCSSDAHCRSSLCVNLATGGGFCSDGVLHRACSSDRDCREGTCVPHEGLAYGTCEHSVAP